MSRISSASIRPFLAFGNASIAVSDVNELARRARRDERARELLVELRAAHAKLQDLFDDGLDDAVCALAQDIMEMASRTADVLRQAQGPSGC
jgi:hypothetical protein